MRCHRRGEERREEARSRRQAGENQLSATPPRRGDACNPTACSGLQPRAPQAAPLRGGGYNPVMCVGGRCHPCVQGCCHPMCPGATSATGRTRRLHAPGSARREIDTLTRRPRETSGNSVAPVPSRSCARHVWCAARTHGTHGTHDTHAQAHARTSAQAHKCAHARLAARPSSPPGPSFRPVVLPVIPPVIPPVILPVILPVRRCGSRATAPASSTRSPTDCAMARRRMRCDGRRPRSYSPLDPNPDPP